MKGPEIRKWAGSLARQAKSWWKYCLSFRKRDWELWDYPIEIRHQEVGEPAVVSRWKPDPVVASIIGWGIFGGGNSIPEAMAKLDATFAEMKAHRLKSGERLPRPGTQVPIKLASQERVHARPALADDFIHRVLGLEWAWISDESSLWDFHDRETNDAYVERVREIYGVDVSDIPDAKIANILERIAASRADSKE